MQADFGRETTHRFYYHVAAAYAGLTIKDYLWLHNYSAYLLKHIRLAGKLYLNAGVSKLYQTVQAGDVLVVDLGEETLDTVPENLPLKVIYEDHDLLVVNKEPFLVTHPCRRHQQGTLANAVAYYFAAHQIKAKVRFVNRLDKNTSGLILIAKNMYAHHVLQQQMQANKVQKVYWAVVEGCLAQKAGVINAPIGRVDQRSIVRGIMASGQGQTAITAYRVLAEFPNASLVELRPQTGRTHQLRVHLRYLGHPILGDDLYNPAGAALINRQALHAREITFAQPRTGKEITLRAELSDDLQALLDILKQK